MIYPIIYLKNQLMYPIHPIIYLLHTIYPIIYLIYLIIYSLYPIIYSLYPLRMRVFMWVVAYARVQPCAAIDFYGELWAALGWGNTSQFFVVGQERVNWSEKQKPFAAASRMAQPGSPVEFGGISSACSWVVVPFSWHPLRDTEC